MKKILVKILSPKYLAFTEMTDETICLCADAQQLAAVSFVLSLYGFLKFFSSQFSLIQKNTRRSEVPPLLLV